MVAFTQFKANAVTRVDKDDNRHAAQGTWVVVDEVSEDKSTATLFNETDGSKK